MPSTSQSLPRASYLLTPITIIQTPFLCTILLVLKFMLTFIYIQIQRLIVLVFKPPVPGPGLWDGEASWQREEEQWYGRIAVVGAGLTGVSSAAHAISHGFLPTIYEASPSPVPGGIWAKVNTTSGLQLNSLLYRFHPGVVWKSAFPKRDEILGEIIRIWKEYQLESRTRFNTPVTSITRARFSPHPEAEERDDFDLDAGTDDRVRKHPSKWIINDGADGPFDAVIVTVGTCGKPKWIKFPGMPDDIGSVERFESPKPKGKEKGHLKCENHDRENRGEDEDKYKHEEHNEHGNRDNKSAKRRDHKREGRKHEHDDDHEENRGQSSSNTYSDADRESASSPTTSSCATKFAEKSKEKEKQSRRERRAREDEHHDRHLDYGEHGRSERDRERERDSSRPQKSTVNLKDEGSRVLKQSQTQRKAQHKSKEAHSRDTNIFLRGPIVHSSQLDTLSPDLLKGKRLVVIGSGASGVEAVETALERGSGVCSMLARDDKWIIPRNILFDTLIAAQPFGREMPLSFIWEYFLLKTHYCGVEDLIPRRPIFSGTPVVNDEFLSHVRAGRCQYIRCDPIRLTKEGVLVNERGRGSKPGDDGKERVIEGDVIVLATGYEKPEIGFLEEGLFPKGHERPNLYLQNFSTEDWTILMTNSAYQNAIGTVGHVHIGIYTRILLTLLLDENARPTPRDMKLWVDVVRFVKRGASGGALGFFTYAELTIWLLLFHLFRPDRIKWMFFIMQGWGVHPQKVKEKSHQIRRSCL